MKYTKLKIILMDEPGYFDKYRAFGYKFIKIIFCKFHNVETIQDQFIIQSISCIRP